MSSVKATSCGGLFLFIARSFLNQWKAERAEREVDDAVRAEDDDEPDDAPHDGLFTLRTLRFISRMRDELKHSPDEEDKCRGR